jgi:hypothetical protein
MVLDNTTSYLSASLKFRKDIIEKKKIKNKFLSRVSKIILEDHYKATTNGDEVLSKIRKLLDYGFGVKRSATQIEIHEIFIESCLPKIYQDVWAKNSPSILKQFNIKKLIQEVLCVMGRRRGKTYATAMFTAACLLCIPGLSSIIFSTGERTSKLLMTVIVELIEKAFQLGTVVKKDDYVFETKNVQCITFYGPDGTKRSLMCLPGSVRVTFFIFFLIFFSLSLSHSICLF